MLLEIGIILLILWALGFAFYPIGGLIHLILIVAIIIIVWDLLTGRKIG